MAMPYQMNENKAMHKKIEATKRDLDVDIKLKRGTLVISFTPAAYELYKHAIYRYFDNHSEKVYQKTTKTCRTSHESIHKAVTEESLSIKPKTKGDREGRQMYRINIDVNGRDYQQFIYEDLPKIITSVDLTGTNILNEKIMKQCKLVLNERSEKSTCDNNTLQPETKSNTKTTTSTEQNNKCVKDTYTLKGRPLEIAYKIQENIQPQNDNTEIQPDQMNCPICLSDIMEQESIECSRCFLWIHRTCSKLTQEQFIEQTSNEELTLSCSHCVMLDDDLTQYELEGDREGTHDDFYLNNECSKEKASEIEQSIHIDLICDQTNQSITHEDDTKLKQVIHVTMPEDHTDLNSEDIECNTHKTYLQYENNNLEEQKLESSEQINCKQKAKRTKKKETLDHDQQLAACKARIIMLEEQNRDYENTINLIHGKWRQENVNIKTEEIQNGYENMFNKLNSRIQNLEDAVANKISHMSLELQHRMTIQELNMKHEFEVRELKTELNIMKYHINNNSRHSDSNVGNNTQNGQTNMPIQGNPPGFIRTNIYGIQQQPLPTQRFIINPFYNQLPPPTYNQVFNNIATHQRFPPPAQTLQQPPFRAYHMQRTFPSNRGPTNQSVNRQTPLQQREEVRINLPNGANITCYGQKSTAYKKKRKHHSSM